MESAVVIKVKYEETLRRFNALIIDGELEFNMDRLREKILSLFKFTPDAELMLTYVDEDNDVVTLGDDDDLRDVVRQALNPLRITVKVLAEKNGRSSARTSGTTTPLRSPRVQMSLQNLNSSAQELLNSVPEPIRKTVTKIWTEVSSAGTPSGHTITELLQCFQDMRLQYLDQLAEVQATAQGSRPLSQDGEGARVEGAVSDAMTSMGSASSKGKVVHQTCESKATESKNDKESAVNVNGGVKALAKQVPGLEDLKAALDSTNPNLPCPVKKESSKNRASDKFGEPLSSGKVVNLSALGTPANAFAGEKKAFSKHKESTGLKRINAHAFPCYPISPVWTNDSESPNPSGETKDVFQTDTGSASFCARTMSECPFSGIPLVNSGASPAQLPSQLQKERRKNVYSDGSGNVFHRGVCCDGCGVHPITGPRFKSKVKDDYDLCSICFNQMGNDNDYIRMDRPVTHRYPHPFKGLYDLHHRAHPQAHPPIFRGGSMKFGRPKLDSRFIQDVNVLDGTVMAPLTPFTKIWRMRNNGSVVWPQGAQLVWIGGDKLSDVFSVAIEIPPPGLVADEELDVAVDFVAPERPGRYISYWRMASPSGQKFGQRVWVLIQVDGSSKEMPYEGRGLINLNLPPVSNGMHGPEIISVNPETVLEDNLPVDNFNGPVQLVEPVIDAFRDKEQEPNFPINDSLLIGDVAGLNPLPGGVPSSSVSYPIIDLSDLAPAVPSPKLSTASLAHTSAQDVNGSEMVPAVTSPLQASVTLVQTSAEDVNETSEMEKALLRDLEEMGFRQVDLNKEILRLNEYDLEKSVDDLCGVSGWDPILEELHEMGFVDKATNTKLLQKNNGSIKRVVMDLLAGEE